MARILVTSGEERSALAAVRSLGRSGHEVLVCSDSGRSLAGASRWARHEVPVVSPLENPDEFALQIGRLAERLECGIVLPVTDPAVLSVLSRREALPAVSTVPFPSIETYRALSDKEKVARAASELDIAVPGQRVLSSPEEVTDEALSDLPYPVVVKPSRSVVAGTDGTLEKTAVSSAATSAELRRRLHSTPRAHFPLLLQEHIPGSGAGVFLLRWGERTYARFAHRRLREKPPTGGVSVYRESVEPPAGLFELSERLMEHFDWQGVGMVEYRVDACTGTPYVMEINGRLWGSLQLAVDAGVDFPRLLVSLALGEDVAPVTTYATGVRSRWEWGDVDHLLQRLKSRREHGPALPRADGGPGLASFFIPWRPGDRCEVFRVTDPRPFFRETRQWISDAVS